MMVRIMRWMGRLVLARPGLVAGLSLCLTILTYLNIHNLRTGTDLTDMFGKNDPQWKAASQIGKELGYGSQLFVLIEVPAGEADKASAMEQAADQLIAQMTTSGLFKQARAGLSEEELMNAVRFYSWNFPYLVPQEQQGEVRQRLDPQQVHKNVRQFATEMVTPFSTLGANYFIADPLGLLTIAAQHSAGFQQFSGFDLDWGSGNRFFSKDHRTLLVIAEPRESAVDYNFAGRVVVWTQQHIDAIAREPEIRNSGIRATQAGAYVYADEDHRFIERNVRRVSMIAIIGNLVLCLLVYPSLPLLLLSLLPANLGILWTTGIASYYPGQVNLISLAFIAILAGLGDDQVVHLFNRAPQEWAKGETYHEALLRTFETTGLSIVLCISTAAIATVSLAFSGFRALAEFGFILTVGMFMMMFHTLLTVPALMQLWSRIFKPVSPKAITFRFLPFLAHKIVDLVGRRARLLVMLSSILFVISMILLPSIQLNSRFEIAGGADSPAAKAQTKLAEKFGIEGSPEMLLIAGGQEEVLRRAEALTSRLEVYRQRGAVKSISSPTSILPSAETQRLRAASLEKLDLAATAQALEVSLRDAGLQVSPHRPYLDRLRELSHHLEPVGLEDASKYLPPGFMDNSIRKTKEGTYVAAITYYAADANAGPVIPESEIEAWRHEYGPFVDFSFNKISLDMQDRILHDSRRALVWTMAGILLIVYATFRNLRVSLLVAMPIVFAIVVTFGLLKVAHHSFSFMSVTAIPLIIGIGIDNGIHLVRRYLESRERNILATAKASGAALILSNLTTIVGFGALMASTFAPLAELGLVASLGVLLALVGGLCLIPAVILLTEERVSDANSIP